MLINIFGKYIVTIVHKVIFVERENNIIDHYLLSVLISKSLLRETQYKASILKFIHGLNSIKLQKIIVNTL